MGLRRCLNFVKLLCMYVSYNGSNRGATGLVLRWA